MGTAQDRWNEATGTVSRPFDQWKLTDKDVRYFLGLTLRLSREYFDEVWNELADTPASGDGDELIDLFDREVGGNSAVEYEWMALSATVKDGVTAFEVYVEASRAEVLRAHGRSPAADESVTWKRDLAPFLKKTLGVPVPLGVSEVRRLRQILTHARGRVRDPDDRRKFAIGILYDHAELTEAGVVHALDALASYVRQVDPQVWAVTWGGERLQTLDRFPVEGTQ